MFAILSGLQAESAACTRENQFGQTGSSVSALWLRFSTTEVSCAD